LTCARSGGPCRQHRAGNGGAGQPETAEPGSCCGSHVARPGREKKGGGGGSVGGADRWVGPSVGPSCKREGERMASGPGCNSNKI
jgi:hypothetical protein